VESLRLSGALPKEIRGEAQPRHVIQKRAGQAKPDPTGAAAKPRRVVEILGLRQSRKSNT
jgi:hypothetical protein